MKEITLNSIILQLLRNKKITAFLILLPMILGMAFGFIKSKGGAPQVSPVDKTYLESKTLQYKAYDESNKAITDYIKNSVYLNIDPKAVPTKTYRIFIAPTSENKDSLSKTGFYYSSAVPESTDYDALKNIIGINLNDKYVDELIPVSYSADTGILTIKGIYSDPIIANALADLNYQRIKNLYQNFQNKDHTLMDLGSVTTQTTDSEIPAKLGTLLQQVDDQKSRMNALMPFIVQNDENTPAKTSSGVVSSMVKWGILGLAGGVALSLLFALLKSPGSSIITDIKEFEKQSGLPYLGFLKQSDLSLADKLVVGNNKDMAKQIGTIVSRLSLAIDGGNQDINKLLVIGKSSEGLNRISKEIEQSIKGVTIHNSEFLKSSNIDELKAADSVLFVDSIRTADKEQLKTLSEYTRKAGKNLLGLILTNQN